VDLSNEECSPQELLPNSWYIRVKVPTDPLVQTDSTLLFEDGYRATTSVYANKNILIQLKASAHRTYDTEYFALVKSSQPPRLNNQIKFQQKTTLIIDKWGKSNGGFLSHYATFETEFKHETLDCIR
jgi:hypothetical protein